MTRELDDRQEMLHRVDTHKTRPAALEPSRIVRRLSWWQRFLRAISGRK
jgi:hypothetical protein